jgi:hypothetical protein
MQGQSAALYPSLSWRKPLTLSICPDGRGRKTGQFSIPVDFAGHNAKVVEFPGRSR